MRRDLRYNLAEAHRRISSMIRAGMVHEVRTGDARARVVIGENLTYWLPWLSPRAGADSIWHAPEVGEQVLVISPGGDLAQGFILAGIFSSSMPAPSANANLHLQKHADGATVSYDRAAHKRTVALPSSGTHTVSVDKARSTQDKDEFLFELPPATISLKTDKIEVSLPPAKLSLEEDKILLELGDSKIELTSGGVKIEGTKVELN